MKVFKPTVFNALVLFLSFMDCLNVFCIAAVYEDENSVLEESGLVLNYCASAVGVENSKEQNILVPSIAMTDYVPRNFRLKKTQDLSCSNLSPEIFFVSFSAKQIVDSADFYSVNGSIFSTEPSYIIYDYDEPENNNVTNFKKTNRLDNLLTPKGMFKARNDYFYPGEFCIERVNNTGLLMRTCDINCKSTPCVNICCPLGEVIDLNLQNCHYSGELEWRPTLYSDIYTKLENGNENYPRLHYRRIILRCNFPNYLQGWALRDIPNTPYIPIKVISDGTVKYVGPKRRWQDLDKVHCVSGLQNYSVGLTSFFSGAEEDQIIFLCAPDPVARNVQNFSYFYVGAMLISCVFLLLTASVYIILWRNQNIHGWTILSFVFSMFFLFVFLSAARLLGELRRDTHGGTFYCIAVGMLGHFFFLSTFCWLSVINFDVWWTLRCNTPLSERSKGSKRFCLYILFAWGGPISVIIIGVLLQHYFPNLESLVMIPDYGVNKCFISKQAEGVYIYYILGILMIWNFLFMSLTFFTLYKFRQGTSSVRSAGSASTHQQNLFHTLIKLFVVCGVSWCFEVISWQYTDDDMEEPWYWIIFDMVNVFQAIGIFVIFVCKRQIINQLQIKYPIFKRVGLRPSGSQNTSTTLRTSLRIDTDNLNNTIKHKLPKQFSKNNVLVGTKL